MNSIYTFSDDEVKEALVEWLANHRKIEIDCVNGLWFSKVVTKEPRSPTYRLTVEERNKNEDS